MRRFCLSNPRRGRGLTPDHSRLGFTLVEMLVAMAITLVMMAAVVTLFANVSGSVRNRRATIEMSGQLRHVRNMLQQDLQGATCPGLTWQRPESNHGYIELIEGQYREGNASRLIDGEDKPDPPDLNPEIDHTTSIIPSSNLEFRDPSWATDGAGLGDYDDILMLTVRNEHEPFVGRVPQSNPNARPETRVRPNATEVNRFDVWDYETIESPLAEVVWFAVENPPERENGDNFFGEPGMRTIYRRTLLIAPWINPYRYANANGASTDTFSHDGGRFKAQPGLVRLLPAETPLEQAIAAIIAFQERYDLSVRLEWDHNIGDSGRWKIMANTLADLTKRENRYEHYSYRPMQTTRDYPYAAISVGSGYTGSNAPIIGWPDPESPAAYTSPGPPYTEGRAEVLQGMVAAYTLKNPIPPPTGVVRQKFKWRPFAFVDEKSDTTATARIVLNDNEETVRIVHGLVPLSNERRGEDVMMTDVLAFDLRLYDPGAPLFRHVDTDTILEPSDTGWRGARDAAGTYVVGAYLHNDNMRRNGAGAIGTDSTTFPYVGQGAYVDMGYGYDPVGDPAQFPLPKFASAFSSSVTPWFFTPRALSDVFGRQLAPGYAVYDTWSFHYENNGVNEDNDEVVDGTWHERNPPDPNGIPTIDEGTNGLEDFGHYSDKTADARLGVDDVGERETVPPYDKPLRGVQVIMRAYERDSRAIRQVRVNQHFMPE